MILKYLKKNIKMNYAVIKYNGKIYRTKKVPFETQEQVMDRLWWSINGDGSDSLKWMYEKYYSTGFS
jgi:hypothetical protein